MTNTKSLLSGLVLLFSLLINSCQKDTDEAGCGSNQPSSKLWGNSVSVSINGRVVDQNGDKVVGAQVSAGSSHTTTDAMGVFHLTDVSAYQHLAYVKVEHPGFFPGSRSFVPGAGVEAVEIKLIPKTLAGTIVGTTGGTVNAQGVSITFSPNSVVKSNNLPHAGNVRVSLAYINPTDIDFTREMPGTLLGVQGSQARGLTSYGMVAVELNTLAGLPLKLAQGQTAEISFPIPPSQQSSAPTTIDLWSFDEENGYWKHEGQATKTGAKYVGQVSHFSFWNCDAPWDMVVLDGLVKTAINQPIQGATVKISGSNVGSASDITNTHGIFSGYVPANTMLTITVSILCDGSSTQVYSANIGPFNSNSTLNTITVTSQNFSTVTGTVTDCNNLALANSYVVADGQAVFAPGGQFSFQTCGTGDLSITPYGSSPWVAGLTHTIQLNSSTVNTGNLQACSSSINATGTVTDIEGNIYSTVMIGNQEWMAENLKVSSYRNGTPLYTYDRPSIWKNLGSGACAVYNNDSANNAIYGKLYNWHAVADPRGLCPTGWHVPTVGDWNVLVITLDPLADTLQSTTTSSAFAGGLMKSTGTLQAANGLWQSPNTGATNISSFTGLPGGICSGYTGKFHEIGTYGYWWSSDPLGWYAKCYFVLNSTDANSGWNTDTEAHGFSVRCVKD